MKERSCDLNVYEEPPFIFAASSVGLLPTSSMLVEPIFLFMLGSVFVAMLEIKTILEPWAQNRSERGYSLPERQSQCARRCHNGPCL